MIDVKVTETIACTAEEFAHFVMNVEEYAQVDRKVGPIEWVRSSDTTTEFKFRSRLPGVPGPGPKVVSLMQRVSESRIDIGYAPPPQNRVSRRLARFSAHFEWEMVDDGIIVTRSISMGLTPALCWFLEPILRRTLPLDLRQELRGAKRHLELRAGAR